VGLKAGLEEVGIIQNTLTPKPFKLLIGRENVANVKKRSNII
jgi:hypothetical protein